MPIPKIFIKEGLQATKTAREAVAEIENAVKTEVINTEKLLRSPASDFFEKKGYMKTEAFWNEPQNFANYARGQYLTEGGAAFQKANALGRQSIETTGNIEKQFARIPGSNDEIIKYVETNPLMGKTRSIELHNGKPYRTFNSTKNEYTYYNPQTGAPAYTKCIYTTETEYKIFAKDGKTVTSEIAALNNGTFVVKERAMDGSCTRKIIKNGKHDKIGNVKGDLDAIEYYNTEGILTKEILFHEGTKTPQRITRYENGHSYTDEFDIDGHLLG